MVHSTIVIARTVADPYHGDHQPRPASAGQAGNKILPLRPRAVVAPLHRGDGSRHYECTASSPVDRRYEPVVEKQGPAAEHGFLQKYPGKKYVRGLLDILKDKLSVNH